MKELSYLQLSNMLSDINSKIKRSDNIIDRFFLKMSMDVVYAEIISRTENITLEDIKYESK